VALKSALRHGLRALGLRFPQLRRYSGRLGLGRLLTRGQTREQILVDGDVVIELDLSVPQFRHYYFNFDLSSAAETVLIRRLVTSSDVFVDVGAHIGYFALVAAKYARHVVAFEPSPKTYSYLQRNIQLNKELASKVTAHLLGLSDHSGTATLFYSPEDPGGSSLRPVEWTNTTDETVTLETLDRVVSARPVAFIKIDVEGAELDVLRGGREMISRDHPIVLCELFEPWQQRFGRTCQDIVGFFRERNYTGYSVQEEPSRRGRVTVKPLDLTKMDATDVVNALFVPSARAPKILARLSA